MSDTVSFDALEYLDDGSVRQAGFAFEGNQQDGWKIERNGAPWLELGPGYRLLRTVECGVCSTDLDRRYLPFPLPQVIGHELIAVDPEGRRHVVEINASHLARGLHTDCPFCASGLPTHCPERLVLGIHALPGGFGGWVLAPTGAVLPVPDGVPSSTAVLVEPFAAALHGVATIAPRQGETVAVLGPRRLGMLVIAALAAWRERTGVGFEIAALARRRSLLELARELGADRLVDTSTGEPEPVDVVVDTTGSAEGLALALRIAQREVHLKSTHGRPAAGIARGTELVVDELSIERFDAATADAGSTRIAWLAPTPPPASLEQACTVLRHEHAAAALAQIEDTADGGLPRADAAVVATAEQIDQVIRPDPAREISLVRPRGRILVLDNKEARDSSELVRAIIDRGVRLSSSRCGSFADALDLMASVPALAHLGERMITHRFDASQLASAFTTARAPECVKAVVTHEQHLD